LSRKYPTEVGNIVTIQLNSGKMLNKRVDVPTGNALRPLTDEQVQGKYHAMADGVISTDRARALADCVWRLEKLSGMEELVSAAVVK
jgi:2-methylcitrate dehydratase PrpD